MSTLEIFGLFARKNVYTKSTNKFDMSEETHTQHETTTKAVTASSSAIGLKELLIPLSIVIAGICIGAGLMLSGVPSPAQPGVAQNVGANPEPTVPADTTSKIDPVTEADWIKGDINAPIKIVEFSDFECPFCQRFHETLEQVMANNAGQVAWVFRQFPLEQLHQKALPVAIASECVGKIGGDAAFWTFTDGYFRDTLTNDRTDINTLIPKLVIESGVAQDAFTACFDSRETQSAVTADLQDATETGGRGTPWSVLIGPTGKTYPINGAQSAAVVEQMIKFALDDAS